MKELTVLSEYEIYLIPAISIMVFFLLVHYAKRKSLVKKSATKKELPDKEIKLKTWETLSLKAFLELPVVKGFINALETGDAKFTDELKPEYLKQIRYHDPVSLLSMCNDIHKKNLTNSDIYTIKTLVSISAIIHSFKVPNALWVLDELVIQTVIRYTMLNDLMTVDLNKYESTQFSIPTIKEAVVFSKIMQNVNVGYKLIAKSGSNNRAVNIQRLTDIIAVEFPKTWLALDEDIYNLKQLMTICYVVSDLSIPKDYYVMNYSVFKYLLAPNSFSKPKNHLTLVKNHKRC